MKQDSGAALIAVSRVPVKPGKNPRYTKNVKGESFGTLCLVCPGDSTTARYLENVVSFTLISLEAPNKKLPVMDRSLDCDSDSLTLVNRNKVTPFNLNNVSEVSTQKWVRVGLGKGFKSIKTIQGIDMKGALLKNCPDLNNRFMILCVGCDGYRSIFSWDELFNEKQSTQFLLQRESKSSKVRGGFSLAVTGDFFVDRCVWGLSYIAIIPIPGDE